MRVVVGLQLLALAARRARSERARRSPIGRVANALVVCCLILMAGPIVTVGDAEASESALAVADRLWEARAERLAAGRAVSDATERALAAYLGASEEGVPFAATIEARWKSLRAAHYLSEFTDASSQRGDRAIEQATRLADEALTRVEQIAPRAGDERLAELSDVALEVWISTSGLARQDVAQLHFWSAIVWGAWAQRVGLLTIVRQGIARRMYDNATLAARLDPTIERGGAYRLLSRLHADLPRVPFVSGWVDRDETWPQAERAFAIDPNDPGNQLILALALRDQLPEPSERAASLLRAVAACEPRADLLAEDLAIREQAADLLRE